MADAGAWGIDERYKDASGEWRKPPSNTINALLAAMNATDAPPPEQGPLVLRAGTGHTHGAPGVIVLEDGGELRCEDGVPSDLPLGYHTLSDDSGERRLIVSPGACHLPSDLRAWGWAVQAYALRSEASWGVGDLFDLRQFSAWVKSLGAGMALVNPLHALQPGATSPYYPSSRCFRDPIYLRPEGLPGADDEVARLGADARALNDARTIDRRAVLERKEQAFDRAWRNFTGAAEFDRYREEAGESLTRFARFVVLAREHGADWRTWPSEYRDPQSGAVARHAHACADRVQREEWLQWQLAVQLRAAGDELDLVHDLAVGIDPGGADAWAWQDVVAPGITVGAPPDEFNLAGQGWGLAAWDPHRLRASGYDAFIQTVRAALKFGGGLRYDHVMGLFRLFWIPDGAGPADGTYVRYPANDLLDILALESHRSRAYVVGEDLGTVEPAVRAEMAVRGMLGYRVLWFEDGPPEEYPQNALATVTNHDLPTVAGMWTGADLEDQRRAGITPNEDGELRVRDRLARLAGLVAGAPAEEAVDAAYALLSRAPSRLVTATLEDAIGVIERPNVPGTTDDERPNWSLALPLSLEEIEDHPGPRRIANILRRSFT